MARGLMADARKDELLNGQLYHVFSRSIAGFGIFKSESDYLRVIDAIRFYQKEKPPLKFSKFIQWKRKGEVPLDTIVKWSARDDLVQIYAHCIMPTHVHLILKQLKENGISIFMSHVLNSYARYLNTKLKRKGPLWENKFKNVLVKTDEQLLHLTRYLHINPTTAGLVDKPEEWIPSSYKEYLLQVEESDRICEFEDILDIEPVSYLKFVEDRIAYQRDLAMLKKLTLE